MANKKGNTRLNWMECGRTKFVFSENSNHMYFYINDEKNSISKHCNFPSLGIEEIICINVAAT